MSDKLCGLAGLGLDNLEDMDIFGQEKKEEQVATDIFKVSITGGIELSYIISQNCPHIAPPYPEGATI